VVQSVAVRRLMISWGLCGRWCRTSSLNGSTRLTVRQRLLLDGYIPLTMVSLAREEVLHPHPQPQTSNLSTNHLWPSVASSTLRLPPAHGPPAQQPRSLPKRGPRSQRSRPRRRRAQEQHSDSSEQEQSPERETRSKRSHPQRRRAQERQSDSSEQEQQSPERGARSRRSKRSRSQRSRSPSLDPSEVRRAPARRVHRTRQQLPTPPSTQPTRTASTTHGPLQRKRATTSAINSEQPLTTLLTSCPPSSIGSTEWAPTHTPSWVLGDNHTAHVHSAAPFLLAVPGGREWQRLLKRYIRFEGLSPSIDVSVRLH
jgi:hypothetical protein